MTDFKIPKSQLEKLRKELPYGSLVEIAEHVGVDSMAVTNVLLGRTRSLRILNAVIDYVKELKEEKNKVNDRIKSVLAENK